MKRIVGVGSTNRTKIKAVQTVFPTEEIIAVDAASNVSAQPVGDTETKTGARNRAVASRDEAKASIGIGLEGGIDIIDDLLFLCNWGALVSAEGKTVYASGARIQLPQSFQQSLLARNELSSLMNAYQNRTDIRSQEGAVGIFSNGEVDRSQLFIHVVRLLKGQMDYWYSG